MPVDIAICWVGVICVAWWVSERGMAQSGYWSRWEEEMEEEKCSLAGKAGRGPPSREREIWILVSFVMRFMLAVRWLGEGPVEPILMVEMGCSGGMGRWC